jgi:hypothetical protein
MNESPPGVLLWQRVYCGAMTLMYVVLVAVCIAMAVFADDLADAETSSGELLFGGILLGIVSLGCAALFAAGLFLPRRRWAWIYHLVLIGLGMTSCACLPATVPLLIFWVRSDTQQWFGGTA